MHATAKLSAPAEVASTLGTSVSGVIIQFQFANPKLISNWLWREDVKQMRTRVVQKERDYGEGILFIEPTPSVGLMQVIAGLAAAKWTMTDAFAEVRTNPNYARSSFSVARFTFHRKPLVRPVDPTYAKILEMHGITSLYDLCHKSMWRVKAYRNQLYEGRFGISINADAREPLVDVVGRPFTRWNRDSNGVKIGDTPVPIEPKHKLTIVDNNIVLV